MKCGIYIESSSILTKISCCTTQILEAQFAASFIEKLAQTCETMLLQFDAVLSLDDVQVGSKSAFFNYLIVFFCFVHCFFTTCFFLLPFIIIIICT